MSSNFSGNKAAEGDQAGLAGKVKILLVDDEAELREILIGNLELLGFEVRGLESGKEIIAHISSFRPDVLLLDQMMPVKSGSELIKEVREDKSFRAMPIIMLTGLNSEEQKVAALNSGADDYVTKPFSVKELQARVHALLRRTQSGPQQQKQSHISLGELVIDLGAHKVRLRSQEVPLTLTEFRILCELDRQVGLVLSRDQLRERALGNLNVTDRTIDVHMASLRKKLDFMGDSIETVRGVGYRMAQVG